MSSRLQHTIIRASAGSGKTYQLANRFIALLLLQASQGKSAPEQLVALTFTRKGAGEFAERILHRLAKAAGEEAERQKLQAQLNRLVGGDSLAGIAGLVPGFKLVLTAQSLQNTLAAVMDQFDRLVLGTIDSFMARSVQTLAFELGLDRFEILEEPAAEMLRQRLLQGVFEHAAGESLEALYQSVKVATLKSASSLRLEVDGFVSSYHKLIHQLPQAQAWGGEGFWNGPVPLKPKNDWRKEAAGLAQDIASHDFGHKRLNSTFASALEWLGRRAPGTSATRIPSWLDEAGKLQELWSNWPALDWSFDYSGKSRTIPKAVLEPLRAVLEGWLAAEAVALSEKTAAIHDIVSQYERLYAQQARGIGRLTFEDLPLLLNGKLGGELAQQAIELLAFRWFQRFEHWLLDEFQDTSRVQWEVLKPWLDEALQDDSGTKSVFVVGDPKQSIYGWRGGEPRLFQELNGAYPGTFEEQVMAQSWRSRPAVLELVNRVCDPATNLTLQDPAKFFTPALERWRYDEHVPEPSRADKPGYAAVLLAGEAQGPAFSGPPEESGAGAEPEEKLAPQARVIKAILEQLEPLKKGLSCAILVRKNDNAQRIAQWLRANGVANVMVEGDATLADQAPVVTALVDGLRWLNSPAHTLAGGHIQITPLWSVLSQPLVQEESPQPAPGSVWRYWRLRLSELGAGEVCRAWCRSLSQAVADPYSQYCLRQVEQLAHRLGGGLTLADWLLTLEQLKVRETAAAGSIHVMTVHKAKGLGFDVVFLPDLDRGGSMPEEVLLRRDEQGRVAGCLVCPPKWLRSWVPELEAFKAAQQAEQDLEALCVLYVALTRAKQATFVILDKEKPRAASRARDWLLGAMPQALGGPGQAPPLASPWGEAELLWEQGVRELEPRKEESSKARITARPGLKLAVPVPRHERRRPSEAAHPPGAERPAPLPAASFIGEEFGTAVHKLFEQIEWWKPGQSLQGPGAAVAAVRACLEEPEIRALFTRDSEQDEACRELPVELVEKNTWWSGIVDRLLLRRDAQGTLQKALLVDFKTDKVDSAEALRSRYAPQVAIYRRAVGCALNLPPSQVEAVLVSTALRKVVVL